MRQWLIDVLKALEAAVPPMPGGHHAMAFAQYGSDADGWTDKLALHIHNAGRFLCFFLEDEDLALAPQKFVAGIVDHIEGRRPLNNVDNAKSK